MTIAEPETVAISTPAGEMRTIIYRPSATGKYPAVMFFSEIFQITAPIRRTALLLAGHGFIVAVPEVYHEFLPVGTVLAYDQAGADRGNELKFSKEVSSYDADARAMIDYLKSRPDCTGKIGSLGICLGGHLSFRAAMNPEVSAGVCFYATDIHKRSLGKGQNDNTLDRMAEVKAEMLMIWGRQDPHVPQDGRRRIYDAMTAANINFTWHEFNGQHAFMRDEGNRYDPELAMRCYEMMVDFYRRTLRD